MSVVVCVSNRVKTVEVVILANSCRNTCACVRARASRTSPPRLPDISSSSPSSSDENKRGSDGKRERERRRIKRTRREDEEAEKETRKQISAAPLPAPLEGGVTQ